MNKLKIGFLGGGNMSISIIQGMVSSSFNEKLIYVCDRNISKINNLKEKYNINVTLDISQLIKNSDILILSVKPQSLSEILIKYKHEIIEKNPLIISLAAGYNISLITNKLCKEISIIRAMPNTPSFIQIGATGLFKNNKVTDEQKNIADSILSTCSKNIWVNNESDIDLVASISGSGPAYFFLFMESMIKAGINSGLSKKDAILLVKQTALGSATMANISSDNLSILRKNVTSKGGVTEKAIESLISNNIDELLSNAVNANIKYSKTLADRLKDN